VVDPNFTYSRLLITRDEQENETYYVYGNGLIGHDKLDGTYRTYHFDLRGSTTAITDISGDITDRFYYAPYGEILSRTGITKTPFMYNGEYGVMTDSNGLYYMRARYYNPDIKRFINQDVIRGSILNNITLNRYAYANGNPISMIDPFGLSADDSNSVGNKVLNGIQLVFDIGGLVPGVGEILDGANAGIYALRGDYVSAGLSLAAMIPFAGWGSTGAKLLKKGSKVIDKADDVSDIIKTGTKVTEAGSKINKVLKFGPNDLVYGPSAGGALRKLQKDAGGKLLNDLGSPINNGFDDILEYSFHMIEKTVKDGNTIHFDLTYIEDLSGVLNATGKYGDKITSKELRFIKDNWDKFKYNVKFYKDGIEVGVPW
jgi:RHS repeat-associated protein